VRRLPLAFLLLAAPATLPAQWRAAFLTGTAVSHGDARDETDPAHPEIHAEAPATLSVSLAREHGGWRIGMEFHHTSADLTEISESAAVSTRDVLKAWGAALEVARRLVGREGAPALHVAVGVGLDRWTFDIPDDSPRWRPSLRGALEAELPINQKWSGVVRSQVSAGPSVFNSEELPDGFVQRTAVRAGLVVGVSRRL
jgi:hypothetical protein